MAEYMMELMTQETILQVVFSRAWIYAGTPVKFKVNVVKLGQ